MKKILLIAAAAAVCLGTVSCGEKKSSSFNDGTGSETVALTVYNEAKIEMADDFSSVRSCVKCSRRYDGDLENIITEELEEYFNSDKSAEETAEMIQNRASVYLSETYG